MSFATDTQRSLTPEQWPLYEKGYRIEPDGRHIDSNGATCFVWRLLLVDTFANRREDFGLHVSPARAWEVAALLAGGNRKAITETSARA